MFYLGTNLKDISRNSMVSNFFLACYCHKVSVLSICFFNYNETDINKLVKKINCGGMNMYMVTAVPGKAE